MQSLQPPAFSSSLVPNIDNIKMGSMELGYEELSLM
jgi:hypothetical protein